MLSILLINKKLCRAEAFSGFLINFPKQNLILITLSNLTITCDKMIIGTKKKKKVYLVQNRKY